MNHLKIQPNQNIEAALYDYIMEQQNQLYYTAFAWLKNQEDAMDALQDAVCKASQAVGNLRNPQAMKSWFYRILFHCCMDIGRKKQKIIPMEEAGTHIADERQNIEYEDYRYLYQALDKLNEKQKPIVILRFFEDKKIDEIAEILEISPNTVKSRLYAALKKLKLNLEEKHYE